MSRQEMSTQTVFIDSSMDEKTEQVLAIFEGLSKEDAEETVKRNTALAELSRQFKSNTVLTILRKEKGFFDLMIRHVDVVMEMLKSNMLESYFLRPAIQHCFIIITSFGDQRNFSCETFFKYNMVTFLVDISEDHYPLFNFMKDFIFALNIVPENNQETLVQHFLSFLKEIELQNDMDFEQHPQVKFYRQWLVFLNRTVTSGTAGLDFLCGKYNNEDCIIVNDFMTRIYHMLGNVNNPDVVFFLKAAQRALLKKDPNDLLWNDDVLQNSQSMVTGYLYYFFPRDEFSALRRDLQLFFDKIFPVSAQALAASVNAEAPMLL